jgi:hypothetical protein
MARASTADLRDRLRVLINDPAGSGQRFDEDALESFLDETRVTVTQARLQVVAEAAPGGVIRRRKWRSVCGTWEAGVTFQDAAFENLTASAIGLISGEFEFAGDQVAVYASGNLHNPHAAAVAALKVMMAREAGSFDAQIGDLNVRLNQPFGNLRALIEQYEAVAELWPGRDYDSVASVGIGAMITREFNY